MATGAALHRKFTLEIDGKKIAAELFRRTNKPLTDHRLYARPRHPRAHQYRPGAGLGGGLGRAPQGRCSAGASAQQSFNGNGAGCGYSIDEIEQIVRSGAPAGENRSDVFHTHRRPLHRLRLGLPSRHSAICSSSRTESAAEYIGEGRLALEVSRSFRKWSDLPPLAGNELAQWTSEWMNGSEAAEAAEWAARTEQTIRSCTDDPELHEEPADVEVGDPELHEEAPQKPAGRSRRRGRPQKPNTEEPRVEPDDDLGDDDDLDDDDLGR